MCAPRSEKDSEEKGCWVNQINLLYEEEALVSPFENEGFGNHYFESANVLLEQSHEKLEEGKGDNRNGDTYGLVTVIYGVVLFLLGINSTIKGRKNKIALTVISLAGFVIATVSMLTIPMPTGFSISAFFGG